MLQGLDVHDAALGLLGCGHGGHLELVGVLLEQVVGHIGHRALRLGRLGGVLDAQGNHHLVLPEGDGVDHGGLDLLGHHGVGVLHEADLRRGLDGHLARELQVVEALLEAVALLLQVARGLGILGQARLGGLGLGGRQVHGAHLVKLLLARQHVHRQLLEIGGVELVHAVEHVDVLEELDLVLLQLGRDVVHVLLDRGVAGVELLDLVGLLAEEAHESLGLLGRGVEALELGDETRDLLTHLA